MFRHGTFIYQPDYAIEKFGSPKKVALILKSLGMSHAWLRVHTATGLWKKAANLKLADALRTEGISVGVWGWNDGNNVQTDIQSMRDAIATFAPDCYIADIEDGVSGANWTPGRAETFATEAKAALGGRPLVISSFGYIAAHKPEIMTAVDPIADFFAPQIYWFWYPKPWMLPSTQPDLAGLPLNDPAAYTKVCIHYWRKTVSKPLVVTGQAYWGEASGWTQAAAENKLSEFLAKFDGYNEIAGLNWWNLADAKAMSEKMIQDIKNANLADRFALKPVPAPGGALAAAANLAPANALAGNVTSQNMIVAAEGLFFRSSPEGGVDQNKIAELDYGALAVVKSAPDGRGYVRATVDIEGGATDGYLHARYLRNEETSKVERAVLEAVREWRRFDKGNGIENIEPYSGYINEYWRARGYPELSGKDRSWAWSAVFISFILENAGYEQTKFDIRHSTYIHQSIQNRITKTEGDFWGYRIDEAKPEVGDLVCQWRGDMEITFDIAETMSRFESHTDIVIAVRDRAIITLGGNVSNAMSGTVGVSVETKTYELNPNGHLPAAKRVFALMKNQNRKQPDALTA